MPATVRTPAGGRRPPGPLSHPEVPVDRRPIAIARETAYASIGLVVTATERARTALSAAAGERAETGRAAAGTMSQRAAGAARQAVERAEPVLAAVRSRTPETVSRVVHDGIARARRVAA
jgi:hypothetical protein